MGVWKEILIKDLSEIDRINFTKLNVIQQDIAELFQSNKLTKLEVFFALNGMLEKQMVNKPFAHKVYEKNYGAILDAENII